MWAKITQPTSVVTTSGGSLLSGTAARKPLVVFMIDDTTMVHYNNLSMWTSRGFRYTTGLRLDYVTGSLTYDKVREMQAAGVEIAYHGQTHNYPTIADLIADIPGYLQIANTEELNIKGFIGPNGSYDENAVFHTHFDTFKWARGAGATNGVANVRNPVDFFKFILSSFIDDLTSQAAVDTLKPKIDALVTRGTGVLTLCSHMDANVAPWMDQLLGYIKTAGIDVVTVSEAYEIYGALIELYDKSLPLGTDFDVRVDGNGGNTINPASPHFILMKDGTVVSNTSAFRMIPPKHRAQTINGNILPNDFPVGVSAVQYGSTDDRTGFPNIGTLYNFNLGKNAGQQFQLYKCHNKGGIYFRESNTDNTWKGTMGDKLGVFRVTKPTATTSAGNAGDYSADANYVYICYADNAWIRVAKDGTWT